MSRIALAALALASCTARTVIPEDQEPAGEVRRVGSASTERLLDILFVVDNSNSMKQEQDSLAENFKDFMNVLATIEGGLPSVHIGVVSSDVGVAPYPQEGCRALGDDGLLQNTPRVTGCQPPNGGARFIEDVVDGATRQRNYSGALDTTFQCIAKLGVDGCGYEQHLEAMRLALDGSRPENGGFLRRDAYLAVVILADEDDCSARDHEVYNSAAAEDTLNSRLGPQRFRCSEYGLSCDGAPPLRAARSYASCVPRGDSYLWHPQAYVDFLSSLKDDPSLIITAVIAGSPSRFDVALTDVLEMAPTCNNVNGIAYPAARLKYVADQFGAQGRFVTICQDNLTDAMLEIARLMAKILETNCLEDGVVEDVDPDEPGLQPQCAVADLRFGVETPLPRCRMRDATTPQRDVMPCWWIRDELAAKCATTHAIEVERAQDAPAGTNLSVRCALEP